MIAPPSAGPPSSSDELLVLLSPNAWLAMNVLPLMVMIAPSVLAENDGAPSAGQRSRARLVFKASFALADANIQRPG